MGSREPAVHVCMCLSLAGAEATYQDLLSQGGGFPQEYRAGGAPVAQCWGFRVEVLRNLGRPV